MPFRTTITTLAAKRLDALTFAIRALEPSGNDSLTDELLESDPAFRELLAGSRASPRKPFCT